MVDFIFFSLSFFFFFLIKFLFLQKLKQWLKLKEYKVLKENKNSGLNTQKQHSYTVMIKTCAVVFIYTGQLSLK